MVEGVGTLEGRLRKALLSMLAGFLLAVCGCEAPVMTDVTDSGIYFESVGSGPPLVLLHGFSLDRRMWADQVEALRDSYRVVRYDLRGHGLSGPPDTPFQPHLDLLEVFEAAQLDSATLIGLSAGAEIAIDFALTFPERVRRLVLASPGLSGYVPQGSFEWMGAVGEALRSGDVVVATERWIETPLMAITEPSADSAMRAIVRSNAAIWTYRQDVRTPFSPPAVDRLEQLSAPTLVVVGANDLQDTHAVASLIVENAPNATLHTVSAVGHLLNMAAPEAFNRVLRGFLNNR